MRDYERLQVTISNSSRLPGLSETIRDYLLETIRDHQRPSKTTRVYQ